MCEDTIPNSGHWPVGEQTLQVLCETKSLWAGYKLVWAQWDEMTMLISYVKLQEADLLVIVI